MRGVVLLEQSMEENPNLKKLSLLDGVSLSKTIKLGGRTKSLYIRTRKRRSKGES